MIGVVILRLVQLMAIAVMGWGLSHAPALVAYIQDAARCAVWNWPELCQRWLLVAAPLLIAALVVAALQQIVSQVNRERATLKLHPNEPWLANPMWAAKHIRQNHRAVWWGLAIFASLYLGLLIPLAVAVQKTPAYVMVGVIGLLALLFLRMLWMNRRWSRAELKLGTLPGVLGGPFSAVAVLHQTFPPETVFDINLRCVESVRRRLNKETKTEHIDRWTSTIYVQKRLRDSQPGTTLVPLSFAIPLDALPTASSGQSPVRWLLSIREKSDLPLGGAEFEVPVFLTSDSRPGYQLDHQLIGQYLERIEPAAILKRYNMVRRTISPEQESFEFRDFDASIFVTLLVMSALLIGVIAGLWYWITNWNTLFWSSLFPLVFLLMFLYGMVHMLLWRSRLLITRGATRFVAAESGLWGWRKRLTLPLDRSTRFTCKLDHRVNEKEQWSVLIAGSDGQSLRLLSTLNGAPEAQAVASWLGQQLQIHSQSVRAQDGFLT